MCAETTMRQVSCIETRSIDRFLSGLSDILVAQSRGEVSRISCDPAILGTNCVCACLKIKSWHFNGRNCYVFIDTADQKIGVMLIGYENSVQKKSFELKWASPSAVLARCPGVEAAVFSEDNFGGGRFRLIRGAGRLCHLGNQLFRRNFYWGYARNYDENRRGHLVKEISEDFKKLLAKYGACGVPVALADFPAYIAWRGQKTFSRAVQHPSLRR